jgi:hypothetical protein
MISYKPQTGVSRQVNNKENAGIGSRTVEEMPKVFSVMERLIIPPTPLQKMVELQGIAIKVPFWKRGI